MKKALPFVNRYFIITFPIFLAFWLCMVYLCRLFRDSIIYYILWVLLNILHFFIVLFFHTDHSLKVGFVLFIFFLIIKSEDVSEEIYCKFGFIYYFVNFIDDHLFRYIFCVFSFCVFSWCTYIYGGVLTIIYSILVGAIVSTFFFSIINDTYKVRRDEKFPLSFAFIVFYHFIFFLIFVKYKDLVLFTEDGAPVFWKYFCLAILVRSWYQNTIGWFFGDKFILMSNIRKRIFGWFSNVRRERRDLKMLPKEMEVSIFEIITFAKRIPRYQDYSLWGWETCMGRLYAEAFLYAFLWFEISGHSFLWSSPFLIIAFGVIYVDWIGWFKIKSREEKEEFEREEQLKNLEEQRRLNKEAEFKWMRRWTKKRLKRRARAKKRHLKYMKTSFEYPAAVRRNKKLRRECREWLKAGREYPKVLERQKHRVSGHPDIAIRRKKHKKEMREIKAELKRWKTIEWDEWRKRGGKV